MGYESKGIEIIREMRAVIAEAEAIGPWIDGHLLKNKRTKYVKKDGSISFYPTLPILQYRVGPKQRKSKRIPLNQVAETATGWSRSAPGSDTSPTAARITARLPRGNRVRRGGAGNADGRPGAIDGGRTGPSRAKAAPPAPIRCRPP